MYDSLARITNSLMEMSYEIKNPLFVSQTNTKSSPTPAINLGIFKYKTGQENSQADMDYRRGDENLLRNPHRQPVVTNNLRKRAWIFITPSNIRNFL
jgi:hypothetical protein